MTATATTKSLATKLAEVTAAVGFIQKLGRNDAQNYDFVRDADVLDALRKELSSRKVAVIVNVVEQTIMPTGTSTRSGAPNFLTSVTGAVEFHDGESDEIIVAAAVGQGLDNGDKGVYKAITGMVKYAMLKTFLIPTGDDPENTRPDERDNQDGGAARPARSSSGASRRQPAQATGADSEAHPDSVKVGLSDKQRGLLKAKMSEAGLAGQQQVAFALATVGRGSSKQMTGDDLDKILEALKDEAKVGEIIQGVKPEKPE